MSKAHRRASEHLRGSLAFSPSSALPTSLASTLHPFLPSRLGTSHLDSLASQMKSQGSEVTWEEFEAWWIVKSRWIPHTTQSELRPSLCGDVLCFPILASLQGSHAGCRSCRSADKPVARGSAEVWQRVRCLIWEATSCSPGQCVGIS